MITKSSTRNSLDSMESKITGKDIICISSMPYGEMWTRKQRLMTIFAEMGNKVLYVEPVESIFASHGNQDSLKPSFKEIKKNLYVLHPGGRLPFARFGFIRDMNLKRYANTVKEYAGKLDFHKPVMFTYLPVIHAHSPFEQLRDYFDISLLIYDCVDEHSETIGYTSEAAEIVHNWDLDLTKKADLTFVTARGLYEDRKHLSDDIYFSPNGADIKHFSKALDDSTEIPSDIAEIPEPRIGFVGSMSDWIDYDLIAEIAKSYPKSSVVLVGPVKGGMKPGILENLPNVFFLGKKKLDELPGYLKGFTCGINPFKRVGIAEKVNPLKVYEYLAAELPVISIDMPEVMPLEGIIYIARNNDQFIEGVGKALSGEFRPDKKELQQALCRHDWDVIFNELIECINRKLEQSQ